MHAISNICNLLTVALMLQSVFSALPAFAVKAPNIVLLNMDNFGYGELGVYGGGITRGAPTPHNDRSVGPLY